MVEELLSGHGRFRAEYAADAHDFLERLAREGQRPSTLFIGCSDSRVIPELLTDAAPGALFVVRNVANRVPLREDADASVGAAIEYAVEQLRVGEIVVCGHDLCGGVSAVLGDLHGIPPGSELAIWLSGIAPAVGRARDVETDPDRRLHLAVQENVLDGMANLMTYSSVAEAVAAGRLRLHGWLYDPAAASLLVYDTASDRFIAPGS